MSITERKLSYQSRKHLPKSDFVFPGEKRYPIEDKPHARNALARVSQNGSSSEKAKVRAAVHRKYPGIGECQVPPLGAAELAELNEGRTVIGHAKPESRVRRGEKPYYYWEYNGQQFPRTNFEAGSTTKNGETIDLRTGEISANERVA